METDDCQSPSTRSGQACLPWRLLSRSVNRLIVNAHTAHSTHSSPDELYCFTENESGHAVAMNWTGSGFGSDSGDRRAQTSLSEFINRIWDQTESLPCETQLAAARLYPDTTGPVTVRFMIQPPPIHVNPGPSRLFRQSSDTCGDAVHAGAPLQGVDNSSQSLVSLRAN